MNQAILSLGTLVGIAALLTGEPTLYLIVAVVIVGAIYWHWDNSEGD